MHLTYHFKMLKKPIEIMPIIDIEYQQFIKSEIAARKTPVF
jgi:hypothetical protein